MNRFGVDFAYAYPNDSTKTTTGGRMYALRSRLVLEGND